MTWPEIEEQWSEVKGQAQLKWAKLSAEDLALVAGKRDRLIGRLEERYGLPRDLGEAHVDEWSRHEATPARNP